MMTNTHARRWFVTLALAAFAATMMAPAAEAGRKHKKHKRHDHAKVVRHTVHRPVYHVVETRRGSCEIPALAGFVGGLVLGAVISNANASYAEAPPHYYYDPYCERRFDSIQVYSSHFDRHHHPRVVRVIEVRSGDCLETLRYREGAWRHWEDADSYDEYDDYDD